MPFKPKKSVVNTWSLRVGETKVYFEYNSNIYVGLVVNYDHGSASTKDTYGDILTIQFGDGSFMKILRSDCKPAGDMDISQHRPNLPNVPGTATN